MTGNKVILDPMDPQDRLDQLVLRDRLVLRAPLVLSVHRDPEEARAQQVPAVRHS